MGRSGSRVNRNYLDIVAACLETSHKLVNQDLESAVHAIVGFDESDSLTQAWSRDAVVVSTGLSVTVLKAIQSPL